MNSKKPKTMEGWYRKQLTGDGRENPGNFTQREANLKKQTKTKIKRKRNADKELFKVHKLS